MLTTAARGSPLVWNSMVSMSSGTPWLHAANAGDAANPFNFIASFMRSRLGKSVSSCITPNLRNGGCMTFWISDSMLTGNPRDQKWSMMLVSKM